MKFSTLAFISSASLAICSLASADMTGTVYASTSVISADDGSFGSAFNGTVVDLWMEFDSNDDVLLNVFDFNLNDANLGRDFYQSGTGSSWTASTNGDIFTTDALLYADSFVTIGGGPLDSNGTSLDPNGDPNSSNSGWYNSNPNNPNGQVVSTDVTNTGLGVFIGRFSINGLDYPGDVLDLTGTSGWATYNQGLGTEGVQMNFTVVPAPGAIALLGLATLAGRRRR